MHFDSDHSLQQVHLMSSITLHQRLVANLLHHQQSTSTVRECDACLPWDPVESFSVVARRLLLHGGGRGRGGRIGVLTNNSAENLRVDW